MVKSSQRGFTLLEAVVALAILAAGASALYAWVNGNLRTLERIDAANARAGLIVSASELMQAIDPREQPEGLLALGDAEVSWRIGTAQYQAPMLMEDGAPGINDAALYPAHVTISRGERRLVAFDMWILGVHETRDWADVLF